MFLNNWDSLDEMKADFWDNYGNKYNGELEGVNMLLASYGTPGCEGDAFVLFERDGKLFEVSGSHCSCYGLKGQWEPEETTIESLRHRLDHGNLGNEKYSENPFAAELRGILDAMPANVKVRGAALLQRPS